MYFITHFFLGFITSFLGSIPPGTVSNNILRITIASGTKIALRFIAGATIAEFIYCFLATHFSSYLISVSGLHQTIRLVSIPIFITIAIVLLVKKIKPPALNSKVESHRSYIFQGIGIGLLNPLQLPFWLTYGAYFISVGWLKDETVLLNTFIIGVCSGSFVCLTSISLLANSYKNSPFLKERTINVVTAVILIALACYQLFDYYLASKK